MSQGKIAHVAIATPNRCGLYETARELVAAERSLGVDARIVDPQPTQYHPGVGDRGVPMAEIEWAAEADILVDHSGIDVPGLRELQKPIIYANHGRPASTFRGERMGKAPALSYWFRRNMDARYKAVVTFWPSHVPYLEGVWTDTPVHAIQPPVDLSAWCPGESGYEFTGEGPHIVIADMWRDDIDPFPVLAAFTRYAKRYLGTLHLYGLPGDRRGIDVYLRVLREQGRLGVVQGHTTELQHIYRAADLVISPHTIYTRTIREAMASGCQVVSGMHADPTNVDRFVEVMRSRLTFPVNTRASAERLFEPLRAAEQFLEVAYGN